jgi:small multidrug resistance family-3 protein
MTGRSIVLFGAAALAEIGGAYLMIGLREGKGPLPLIAGAIALVAYGLITASNPATSSAGPHPEDTCGC